MADSRARVWSFIVYPESINPNWRYILDDTHIPWLESPLHDKDLNPTGEEKKSHIHVLLSFDGKKSYEQVKEITDSISATIPIRVQNIKGMIRYFVHLDNPDKAQYDINGLVCHNGFDISDAFTVSKLQRYEIIAQMMEYIEDNAVTEFTSFETYCRIFRRSDWFPLLCDSCAYVVDMKIRSIRNHLRGV